MKVKIEKLTEARLAGTDFNINDGVVGSTSSAAYGGGTRRSEFNAV